LTWPGKGAQLAVPNRVWGVLQMRLFLMIFLLAPGWAGVSGNAATAHPGGLNAEGCHNNRKTGGYHCHRGPASAPVRAKSLARSSGRDYANCAQARAAGAAPVRAGDPGYGRHLDRVGDGVGCE
jgi:hypothetical protein